MNQAPTKVKKEIYNIKEIHVNGIRPIKLEFLARNKVKAKTPRKKQVKMQVLLVLQV